MMKAKQFKGANVFMSRNVVEPEVFDALLNPLKLNGADVFLCCDPSRTGPNDFHVISSSDHEKFKDLRAKGCNLLGPQCVLSCAKENRALPKRGFTCCLAMDGPKVLTSGFDIHEKLLCCEACHDKIWNQGAPECSMHAFDTNLPTLPSFTPVILPDSARLELKILKDARSNAWVSFDEKRRQQLSRGDSVGIYLSKHLHTTVNKSDQTGDWFHSLIRCLNWNEGLFECSKTEENLLHPQSRNVRFV